MNKQFKEYLFEKRIFVNDSGEKCEGYAEISYAMALKFGIKITSGIENASLDMVELAADILGTKVPQAFYKGFPESVLRLVKDDEALLLLDQMLHYFDTYMLGNFDEAGHSLFEETVERTALKENNELKEFKIVTEEEAKALLGEYVEGLLASTRDINDDQLSFVKAYIVEYGYQVKQCANKRTAFNLLLDTDDMYYTRLFTLSDVIKLVEEIQNTFYYGDIKSLNLSHQHRKLITKVIDEKFTQGRPNVRECFEKRALWKGLLHHIHYTPKCDAAQEFLTSIRKGENKSVYSEFERAMASGDVKKAVDTLVEGKGSADLIRHLNYVLSRCERAEDISYVMNKIETNNPIVIIQMLMQYKHYSLANESRTFKFIKNKRMVFHEETPEEELRRKSQLSLGIRNGAVKALEKNLEQLYSGMLGKKIYIEDGMEKIALPLQEGASMGGYGVLPKGSRISLPEGKKVRLFTYWEGVDDIDLSLIGYKANGETEEFSWRNMSMDGRQSDAICFSGDETSGFNGGSEFYDIVFSLFKEKYPDIRYVVACNNVFSGTCFNNCLCKAGYMIRDIEESGEVFEPKTVESSFVIDCESNYAYLIALDIEKREIVWLNLAIDSDERIAGESVLNVMSYLDMTEVISLGSFFTMIAGEVVTDPKMADIIVGAKEYELSEGQKQITPYDTEALLALMNKTVPNTLK